MKFKDLNKGEVLSTTMYVTVQSKDKDSIKVKDTNGQEFTIRGTKLIEDTMNSAAQYTKEEKVSRTKAAEILSQAGDAVFTAVFDKADGTERTLVGRLVETENHMGRSNVVDLEVTSGTNLRQVDHRTLKSLTLKGIKYIVKK